MSFKKKKKIYKKKSRGLCVLACKGSELTLLSFRNAVF